MSEGVCSVKLQHSGVGLPNLKSKLPFIFFYNIVNNAALFQPKFGSNMDKPKFWVENAIKNVRVES